MYKEREIEKDGKRKRKTVKGGRENESNAHTLRIYIYSKAHTLILYIYVYKSGACRKAYRDV